MFIFYDHALTAAHVDIHGQVLGDKYYEKEAFVFWSWLLTGQFMERMCNSIGWFHGNIFR